MGIIEKILCKLFPYTDIMRDDSNDIYLRRWFVYPRNKEFKKLEPRLYIHKFYRGDEDPHPHDHPWKFTSLILKGGYWEETEYDEKRLEEAFYEWLEGHSKYRPKTFFSIGETPRMHIYYSVFSLLRRPANTRHRVILDKGKYAWTLVLTGIKERGWGFWIKDTFCPWRKYKNGVCWCEDVRGPQ